VINDYRINVQTATTLYTALNKEREHIKQQKLNLKQFEANGSQQYQTEIASFTLKNSILRMWDQERGRTTKNAFEGLLK